MNYQEIDRIVEKRVKAELTTVEDVLQEQYNEILNELYSFAPVGGPFVNLQPSTVLQECDSVAYREGLLDHLDQEAKDGNLTEIEGEMYLTSEVDEIREEVEAEQEEEEE